MVPMWLSVAIMGAFFCCCSSLLAVLLYTRAVTGSHVREQSTRHLQCRPACPVNLMTHDSISRNRKPVCSDMGRGRWWWVWGSLRPSTFAAVRFGAMLQTWPSSWNRWKRNDSRVSSKTGWQTSRHCSGTTRCCGCVHNLSPRSGRCRPRVSEPHRFIVFTAQARLRAVVDYDGRCFCLCGPNDASSSVLAAIRAVAVWILCLTLIAGAFHNATTALDRVR